MRTAAIAAILFAACAGANARPQYDNEKLPRGNATVFAVAKNDYGTMIFARGKDNVLYQRYKYGNMSDYSDWFGMKPPPGGTWDSDASVGVNPDGRAEVFIRFTTNLDLWQYYQLDPRDPTGWLGPRECSCVDMDECRNKTLHPDSSYYNTQPVFPTSDVTIVNDRVTGGLVMYYRGFNGQMFSMEQKEPGNGSKWGPPASMSEVVWV